jgi:hypothetical protein
MPLKIAAKVDRVDREYYETKIRPQLNMAEFGKENAARLAICRRIQQQILYFVERNAEVSQYDSFRWRNFVADLSLIG